MLIFIDFDDVLFNTKKFRNEIIRIFSKHGISRKEFYATYRDFPTKGKKGLVVYDPEAHFKKIRPKIGRDAKRLKDDFWKLVRDSKEFVFRDAIYFLEGSEINEMHLLSFGDGRLQRRKIKGSGLSKYFSKVMITDRPKGRAIKDFFRENKIKKSEKVYFIDDREMFIRDVKKGNSSVVTFLMKRKEGRYDDKKSRYCDYEVKNLKQALKIINTKNGK